MTDKEKACAELIEIVRGAGDVGVKTLVRGLVKSGQLPLARLIDGELAEQFVTKPSRAFGVDAVYSLCISIAI